MREFCHWLWSWSLFHPLEMLAWFCGRGGSVSSQSLNLPLYKGQWYKNISQNILKLFCLLLCFQSCFGTSVHEGIKVAMRSGKENSGLISSSSSVVIWWCLLVDVSQVVEVSAVSAIHKLETNTQDLKWTNEHLPCNRVHCEDLEYFIMYFNSENKETKHNYN